MPELPDVEYFKQYLDATSLHKIIEEMEVKSSEILGNVAPDELRNRLKDHRFQSTRRHGKHLFVSLDNDYWLALHFGMTGRLKYFKNLDKDPQHDRLLIAFSNGYHLAYDCQRKFGQVNLIKSVENFIKAKDLGPDALELDFPTFRKIFEGRRGSIKYTLMNQHFLAGIGNIYSDEILFQTGIHPKNTVDKLDRKVLKELFENMRKVFRTAIGHQAKTREFPDNYLISHRSAEGRCPVCGSRLVRQKFSGRTAYYCPKSQKKP